MGSRGGDGLWFGQLPRASVSPSDEKCLRQGWEALADVPCGREGGLRGRPPVSPSPTHSASIQAEALHLLQVPREGDERHRGQRVQRGVGVAHHPAGRSEQAAAPGAGRGVAALLGHPPMPRASLKPHHPLLPPASPRGSPHHPLRHPPYHHVGAHPLAGTVPSALQSVTGLAGCPLGR